MDTLSERKWPNPLISVCGVLEYVDSKERLNPINKLAKRKSSNMKSLQEKLQKYVSCKLDHRGTAIATHQY